ncbi:hypothetical protein D3C77_727490 [compost metagenome]
MVTAEQREGAGYISVVTTLSVVVIVPADVLAELVKVVTHSFRNRAGHAQVRPALTGRQHHFPAVGEAVFQAREGSGVVLVPELPVAT